LWQAGVFFRPPPQKRKEGERNAREVKYRLSFFSLMFIKSRETKTRSGKQQACVRKRERRE
jgi:hypothetical protein